jgi:histidinol-phosphatase (PHP family)
MLADYHLHTEYSGDSNVSMQVYVEEALKKNFREICFTDHIDFDVPSVISANPQKYFIGFQNIKKIYTDKLNIKFGMEFGVQNFNVNKANNLFKSYPFDFIILSFHTIDKKTIWNCEYQQDKTQKEFNDGYYNEMYEVVKRYQNYSVLGHIDVIRRYDKYGYYDLNKTKPILEQILKQVIKDGKGIEINTSSFRYKIPDLMPSVDILKFYKELGGEIITIGSDSHSADYFGHKIADIQNILKEIGFNNFYTFDKMTPTGHKLGENRQVLK